ncbi:UDP-2,3-diacylglucosamine diphosphatase [Aestuariirhabdus sp. Z084]|uniref:UDP-2,3-diacylglucosamine diphosphatase n=1 Tax=Aestuariirhabdus haliotis TaxID=2918751 RepID=UPI00201B37E1|nr:UDP-2,3-diacylglucosamine diphosphatase [Aestuariirhabdus haliotis]MCL6415743.1 UDP-2,3-diacylglucosamine diphosphatase [Aestuariirhabdus haliotis]MCL6419660.1 UDP-2,3-diacylglucosamine diphosphatase [Aestuariirhabdus haliotis]
MKQNSAAIYYRTLWLSDIHLGNKDCHADYLLDLLSQVQCDHLYLLGDIVDILALKKRLYWPSSHYEVLRCFQRMAANGTRVTYIPGNHDAPLRDFAYGELLGIEVCPEAIHQTADGKRLLLLHGDEFDHAVMLRSINRLIGLHAHDLAVFLNRWTHRARRLLGMPYWSFANYLKEHVKQARDAIESYELLAMRTAAMRGFDGIVCGHIHKPEIRYGTDGQSLYCNTGDWTESCTAMVETLSGELQLLHWSDCQETIRSHHPHAKSVEQDTRALSRGLL